MHMHTTHHGWVTLSLLLLGTFGHTRGLFFVFPLSSSSCDATMCICSCTCLYVYDPIHVYPHATPWPSTCLHVWVFKLIHIFYNPSVIMSMSGHVHVYRCPCPFYGHVHAHTGTWVQPCTCVHMPFLSHVPVRAKSCACIHIPFMGMCIFIQTFENNHNLCFHFHPLACICTYAHWHVCTCLGTCVRASVQVHVYTHRIHMRPCPDMCMYKSAQ